MQKPAKAIGERIRAVRKSLRLTQAEFAKRLGVTNKAVSFWELGDTTPPIETIQGIVTMGNRSCDWLIFGFDRAENCELSDEERQLLEGFRLSSREDRAAILRIVDNAAKRTEGMK